MTISELTPPQPAQRSWRIILYLVPEVFDGQDLTQCRSDERKELG
jgi:hypothetical protein